ncbi:MAG TPA: SDR family oxidoreductase [Ohtaekwangia sp.]|nr:SDR family oxidoreductase [Ohtaekwangia sp.]
MDTNALNTTDGKYALITGATSGIGYELAKVFAEHGYNLVIVARTPEDLNTTADELADQYGINVIPIAKDLFQDNAAFDVYEEVKSHQVQINVLVNDAGQGVYGLFAEGDIRKQLQIIDLNVKSLTALTYLFLQDMTARNEGKILQLASIVSDIPAPLQAVYGGTKAFVLSFSEALRNELKDTNITITSLQPGATDTDFFNKAGAQDSKLAKETKLSDPADVARDGFDALMKGEDKIVSGFKNKVQSAMSNVMSDETLAAQMRKQSERSEKD